jgi:hypothetical protein
VIGRVNEVLRENRSGTGGERAARQVLPGAQVGLAFVLLAGAGLFWRASRFM